MSVIKRHIPAIFAVLVIVFCAALLASWAMGSRAHADTATVPEAPQASEASETPTMQVIEGGAQATAEDPFPSWNKASESLAALVSYVDAVTDPNSPDFIPEAARIAVFDMDGTILCEKAPVYVDYCLVMHRVLEDPTCNVPDEITQLFEVIREYADQGIVAPPSELPMAKDEAMPMAFAGMTIDEYHAYVNEFIENTPAQGFGGMTYAQSFYLPMLEVIDYLRANGFDVYIVSACGRETTRAIACERLGIAPDHVIASDWSVESSGQNGAPGIDYTFQPGEQLVFTGEFLGENGKNNKVIAIAREIGARPVLAFGNSSGDFAMLNYAASNDEHRGMGVLIVADDTEREYGDPEKAASMLAEAADAGWTAVSMRDDWSTIYGPGVEKTCLPAEEGLAEAA